VGGKRDQRNDELAAGAWRSWTVHLAESSTGARSREHVPSVVELRAALH
jgi:hypothetical protein